jgi:hypothetical protein
MCAEKCLPKTFFFLFIARGQEAVHARDVKSAELIAAFVFVMVLTKTNIGRLERNFFRRSKIFLFSHLLLSTRDVDVGGKIINDGNSPTVLWFEASTHGVDKKCGDNS